MLISGRVYGTAAEYGDEGEALLYLLTQFGMREFAMAFYFNPIRSVLIYHLITSLSVKDSSGAKYSDPAPEPTNYFYYHPISNSSLTNSFTCRGGAWMTHRAYTLVWAYGIKDVRLGGGQVRYLAQTICVLTH